MVEVTKWPLRTMSGSRWQPLTRDRFASVLAAHLRPGDFLLNLSVDVSSLELLQFASSRGALYLGHGHRALARRLHRPRSVAGGALQPSVPRPGAGPARGAGPRQPHGGDLPGSQSRARITAPQGRGARADECSRAASAGPTSADGWASLFRDLGIRTIQISEHDSQVSRTLKVAGEFVSTWSVDGFLGEGAQPAELGWGTAEGSLPPDAGQPPGDGPGIYLLRPGVDVRVRSWAPAAGPFVGYLITHMESLSIADHLTLRSDGRIVYRPTVHYAYRPCPDALLSVHELVAAATRRSRDTDPGGDIVSGQDELGVLLAGHAARRLWFGSQLTIAEARVNRAARQCHRAAGGGRDPGRHGGRYRSRPLGLVRAGGARLPPRAGGSPALSRSRGRRLVGLDAAHRARAAVSGDRSTAPTPGGSPMSGSPESGRARA